ncbi:MAG: hypothetical protein K2Q33_05240 [Gammaproteobacteria bacterium]|nr:hypothetical protein [Gammaproteobacteria bacterium]
MLKSKILKIVKSSQLFFWGLLLSMPMMALAEDTGVASTSDDSLGLKWPTNLPDIVSMLISLDKSFPALFNMMGGLAYLFGVGLIVEAIWKFRKYGEGISMVSQRDIREPIMHLIIGALLVFAPSATRGLLTTVFGADSILPYAPTIPDTAWQLGLSTIIVFVQFVGFVAIVRGLLHLHKAAGGQTQQNAFAKGIVHLVGGVLSLNIVATKNILYSTLGLTT